MIDPHFSPLGDGGIAIRLGVGISEALSDTVVNCARMISSAEIIGVSDVVPSYATLTVFYDPTMIGYDDIRGRLVTLLAGDSSERVDAGPEAKVHRIPVVYDGEDLDDVASRTGLSRAEVIAIHSGVEYRVFVTGFVPGFAYLGILDTRLALPRRESPRKRVPSGSVAIADRQTGIYPAATPGGWHLIGTTAEKMFDPSKDPPSLLEVGDRVRFEPVG
ncbi:MAG: 5-oxoprolinase subunit PxpB [Gemmatimonadales bacterium]